MALNLVINGVTYKYPEVNEPAGTWGKDATNWAIAVSGSTLQPTGGLFNLTADVTFGSNYGLQSLYYKSNNLDVSQSGELRLGNSESIGWRNVANTGDNQLTSTNDALTYNSNQVVDISNDQFIYREPTITGLVSGGSVTKLSPTTISVTAGVGEVIDTWTTPDLPVIIPATIPATPSITIAFPDNFGVQSIYFNPATLLIEQQSQPLSNGQRRSLILLAEVYYQQGAIDKVVETKRIVNNSPHVIYDFINFLSNTSKVKGLATLPSVGLSVYQENGTWFSPGANSTINIKDPNVIQLPAKGSVTTPVIFDVVFDDGTVYLTNQTVLPFFYQSAPLTATAITGNDATIHYMFRPYDGGNNVVQLGQFLYGNGKIARDSLQTDISNTIIFPGGELLLLTTQIYVQNNKLDFTDSLKSGIVNLLSTPTTGGGGQVGATTYLGLDDVTDTTYAGNAGKSPTVNPTETGLTFSSFLPLTGGTLTGNLFATQDIGTKDAVTNNQLILSTEPTSGNTYIVRIDGTTGAHTFLNFLADGNVSINTSQSAATNSLTRKDYVDAQDAKYLPLIGGTLTGNLFATQDIGTKDAVTNNQLILSTEPTTGSTYIVRIDGTTGTDTYLNFLADGNVSIDTPQSTATNSLTRKDYVDTASKAASSISVTDTPNNFVGLNDAESIFGRLGKKYVQGFNNFNFADGLTGWNIKSGAGSVTYKPNVDVNGGGVLELDFTAANGLNATIESDPIYNYPRSMDIRGIITGIGNNTFFSSKITLTSFNATGTVLETSVFPLIYINANTGAWVDPVLGSKFGILSNHSGNYYTLTFSFTSFSAGVAQLAGINISLTTTPSPFGGVYSSTLTSGTANTNTFGSTIFLTVFVGSVVPASLTVDGIGVASTSTVNGSLYAMIPIGAIYTFTGTTTATAILVY